MRKITFAVKCPRCSAQAIAKMHSVGIAGTYREPMVTLGAQRIVCTACGFNQEVPVDKLTSVLEIEPW